MHISVLVNIPKQDIATYTLQLSHIKEYFPPDNLILN